MASEEVTPPKHETAENIEHVQTEDVAHVQDAVADRKPTFKDVWRQKRNLAWCKS